MYSVEYNSVLFLWLSAVWKTEHIELREMRSEDDRFLYKKIQPKAYC